MDITSPPPLSTPDERHKVTINYTNNATMQHVLNDRAFHHENQCLLHDNSSHNSNNSTSSRRSLENIVEQENYNCNIIHNQKNQSPRDRETTKRLELLEKRIMAPPLHAIQQQQQQQTHLQLSHENNPQSLHFSGNCSNDSDSFQNMEITEILLHHKQTGSQHSFTFDNKIAKRNQANATPKRGNKMPTNNHNNSRSSTRSPSAEEVSRCADLHIASVSQQLASIDNYCTSGNNTQHGNKPIRIAATATGGTTATVTTTTKPKSSSRSGSFVYSAKNTNTLINPNRGNSNSPINVNSNHHSHHSQPHNNNHSNSSRSVGISSNQTLITAHVRNTSSTTNHDLQQQHSQSQQPPARRSILSSTSASMNKSNGMTSINDDNNHDNSVSTFTSNANNFQSGKKRKSSQPLKNKQPSLPFNQHQPQATCDHENWNHTNKRKRGVGPSVQGSSLPIASSSDMFENTQSQRGEGPIISTGSNVISATTSNHNSNTNGSITKKSKSQITTYFPMMKKKTKSITSSSDKQQKLIQTNQQQISQHQQSPLLDQYRQEIQEKQNEITKLKHGMIQFEDQISKLQTQLNDNKAQLKAVSNNHTIMNTQLKSALTQREQEIRSIKLTAEVSSAKHKLCIETLIRQECQRDQHLKRQKLASDGARLGRWVYSRVGMRVEPVWEDGDAVKELKARKASLRLKREHIEARLKNNDGNEQKYGGNDPLEQEEYIQSNWFHLEELRREEMKVKEEEDVLRLEKAEHKRELRRVSNEDGSRFKSRPKLHDRYIPLYLLGKGGFSEVWRSYDLCELREVAVKIHQLDPRWSEAKIENYTKHVAREYEIHRDVRHPRIVSLYDVFEIDKDSFATVLECCNGTDLDTLLQERKTLPEKHAKAILLQILSGMKYLTTPAKDKSRQGIIHYDLKPGNILFDEFGDAKITDFGLSKIMDSHDPSESMELTSQGAGTYWYLPPECFVTTASVRITNRVDVWSIGVIFFQMLYGKRPFGDGQSQERVLTNNVMLNARAVHFPSFPEISAEAKDFICKCLTYEQSLRPNIAQLCETEYIRGKK